MEISYTFRKFLEFAEFDPSYSKDSMQLSSSSQCTIVKQIGQYISSLS
ncbi:hypothetical protein LEP1GSC050_1734 [Leptospira broomii serovar Hurstbridge str. 5399]|uniref:Uncharacterized protein n=1 Tax=Leptospira broomii serovar Hurstbridge str. 5399 TaxID=1049789 RepID=T0G9J4_9LEPT|nr:hypothetical protein LEP1GSC050_1734 [Leptospira broomii serovar Hurstbridge str. 5399]